LDEAVEPRLKALMVRGLAGDRLAHAQMLSEFGGYLRAFFGRRLGPGAADLEDLVQDTLLAIHLKRETWDRRQPLTPWAYAIARYKLIDHFRRTGRRPTTPLEDAGELIAEGNPEEGAVRQDVARLLSRLPAKARALVEAVKLKGFSMEEAAAQAGMSVTATKVAVHRAMKSLEKGVEEKGVRDED
jgi:RNA polymerase sigma-70 factor (ECF subfamily)